MLNAALDAATFADEIARSLAAAHLDVALLELVRASADAEVEELPSCSASSPSLAVAGGSPRLVALRLASPF